MNHVVLAPDKFKGCLTANEVAVALAKGIRRHLPDTVIVTRPVADGGEGPLNAFTAAGNRNINWGSGMFWRYFCFRRVSCRFKLTHKI